MLGFSLQMCCGDLDLQTRKGFVRIAWDLRGHTDKKLFYLFLPNVQNADVQKCNMVSKVDNYTWRKGRRRSQVSLHPTPDLVMDPRRALIVPLTITTT